jgi:ABC-2 type transport system ATP-binding protein
MTIQEGEIVGFIGPNGAGKSTTIKMMTGVLEPTDGKILVNGRIPFKNRQRNAMDIGVVFGQRTQLWWDLPVIESFKVLKEIYRVDQKAFEQSLDTFNELVNLKALYSQQVRSLSLGQRMLCDIVASFLHNPKVIFLDEPTIGLDISIKTKIRSLIKELNEMKKTTILLTTHDISDIEALCKRIIIIDKGTIIYDGDTERTNKLFGSYRTLKVESNLIKNVSIEEFAGELNEKFPCKNKIIAEKQSESWLNITLNQDEVKLLDVLNYLVTTYSIRDIKTEEMEMETVIRKVYEGALL